MARMNLKEEELLQTHVLNLTEIREAEEKEKKKKYKKVPVILCVLGVFLIVFGLASVKVISLLSKIDENNTNTVKSYATKVEKNSIICLSEFYDDTNTYKISVKSIYKFNGNGLSSKESKTEIELINKSDNVTLSTLSDHYKEIYQNSANVINNIKIDNGKLYFDQSILNYDRFDYSQYNPEINKFNKTSVFKGGEKMQLVKEKEISLKNSCS